MPSRKLRHYAFVDNGFERSTRWSKLEASIYVVTEYHISDGIKATNGREQLRVSAQLTQQMGIVFNPMVDQIGRTLESFGVQLVQTWHRPLGSNADRLEVKISVGNQERLFIPRVVEPITYENEELVEQCEPRTFVVRRYQDADRVLRNARSRRS